MSVRCPTGRSSPVPPGIGSIYAPALAQQALHDVLADRAAVSVEDDAAKGAEGVREGHGESALGARG